MTDSSPRTTPTLWVALAAAIVLLAGVMLASRLWRRDITPPVRPPTSSPRTGGSGTESPDEPGEDVIAEALRGAPGRLDSTEIKSRWVNEVRGMELGGLAAAHRDLFVRFANAERCTCGCGYTLAGCRASDMTCEVSGARLDALLDSVRTGLVKSARGIRARPLDGG